jgi:hypothetical protein
MLSLDYRVITTKSVTDQVVVVGSSSALLFSLEIRPYYGEGFGRAKHLLVSTKAPSSRLNVNKNLLLLFYSYLLVMTLGAIYNQRLVF